MRFFEELEDFPGRAIKGPRPSVISVRPTPGLGRRDGRPDTPVRGVAAGAGSEIGPIAPSREIAVDQRFSASTGCGDTPASQAPLSQCRGTVSCSRCGGTWHQATTAAPVTWRAEAVPYTGSRTLDTKLRRNKSALTSIMSGCSVFRSIAITTKEDYSLSICNGEETFP